MGEIITIDTNDTTPKHNFNIFYPMRKMNEEKDPKMHGEKIEREGGA